MGITRPSARLLLDEARRRPFGGEVLSLGRMNVYLRYDELLTWAERHGVELATSVEPTLSHHPELAEQGCLSDRSFFSLLGFDAFTASDVTRWEGADIVWDLNQPAPDELHGRFDVVFEGGTIQHVFDQAQVFRNIRTLLKPGGRAIHGMSPSNNHVDHGFYMFSPTLFDDAYRAAGFEIDAFFLFDFVPYWVGGRLHTARCRVYRYTRGSLEHLAYGRWGNRQTSIFVVATKPDADGERERVPQQGYYRDLWEETGERVASEPPLDRAARFRDPAPPLRWYKLARELARRWGPKRKPPLFARY